jgi:hypothetical protein
MDIDSSFDPKKCYLILQVAHIVCKKGLREMLSETVSVDLSAAYETLQASSLVFVRESEEKKGEILLYYKACYAHDEKLQKGSTIILIIPCFDVYILWGILVIMLMFLACRSLVAIGVHGVCCQE